MLFIGRVSKGITNKHAHIKPFRNFLHLQKLLVDVYEKIAKGRITEDKLRVDLQKSFPAWNLSAGRSRIEEVTRGKACSVFRSSL